MVLAASTVYASPRSGLQHTAAGLSATLAGFARAGNTRGILIYVSGTCHENVVIGGFDHLTLQGAPTATIQDASNGTLPTVEYIAPPT